VLLLVSIVLVVATQGLSTIFPTVDGHITFNTDYFTKTGVPGGSTERGGVLNGIVGTLEMLLLGAVIAVPIGLGTAIYLSEYGTGRLANVVRFIIDLLAGLPSVLVGLFILLTLINSHIINNSGLAGALGLAIIIIPIVASSVESILQLVPNELREAGYALGMPQWRVVLQIVIPTVLPGVITGVILALARAAGETAPLLLTTAGSQLFLNFDLTKPMTALTLQIYEYATSPYDEQHGLAWANALLLISIIAMISAAVRYITRREQYDS